MLDEIKREWDLWKSVPFPTGASELNRPDLVSIDTFSAGCISFFIESRGKLDTKRIACLRQCSHELDTCLDQLSGDTRKYFERLSMLSKMVLNSVDITSPETYQFPFDNPPSSEPPH
jgi:hypothetical protein